MIFKTQYANSKFKLWIEKLLTKTRQKITELKQEIKHKQTKPELCDPDVKKYLEDLHQKLGIAAIDKASNNFAFIYRKYYISKLLEEVSPNKNKKSTSTYSHKHKILKRNLLKLTWNIAKNLILK